MKKNKQSDNPYLEYEAEKRKLRERDLTPEEYEIEIRRIADESGV